MEMLSQRFCLMESCVCSVRGDIGELAANPFSEHMQTFLFAFHSQCRHRLRLEGSDEGGSYSSLLLVTNVTPHGPDEPGRVAGGASDVYQRRDGTAAGTSISVPI